MDIEASITPADTTSQDRRVGAIAFVVMVALIAIAPFFAYPFFIMQAMCFALFACAFNLLIGYANLLSLGHAMFLGLAGLCLRPCRQSVGTGAGLGDRARRRRFRRAWLRHRSARHSLEPASTSP